MRRLMTPDSIAFELREGVENRSSRPCRQLYFDDPALQHYWVDIGMAISGYMITLEKPKNAQELMRQTIEKPRLARVKT